MSSFFSAMYSLKSIIKFCGVMYASCALSRCKPAFACSLI